MKDTLLRAIGAALDGLEIAFCALDRDEQVLAWNNTFFTFFPEQRDFIHVGEHYSENLRRFYALRLAPAELPLMERYIAEGVKRHREQRRPFEFEHHDLRLRVSAVDFGSYGRLRIWRALPPRTGLESVPRASYAESFTTGRLLEHIPDGVLVVDRHDQIVWANQPFLRLYGLSAATDAIGKSFEEVYRLAWRKDPAASAFRDSLEVLAENQRFSGAPFELSLPGDRWVRVVEQRSEAADGTGYFVHVDITVLRRQTDALRAAEVRARLSEERYRLLAQYSSDVTAAVVGGHITYVSPSVEKVFGWRPEQVIGQTVAEYCHPDDFAGIRDDLQSLSAQPERDHRARVRTAGGDYVWVEARARVAPPEDSGGESMLVLNIRSIAARKAIEDELDLALERLEELAAQDGLTGLANRRAFDEALGREWRRAQRESAPLALLLLDLDHFKDLNDEYGHPAGDAVLREFADVLNGFAQRAGDVAARYGGEEFALLLPEVELDQAAAVAEAVRQAVHRLKVSGWDLPTISISVGVCAVHAPPPGLTPDDLVRAADDALYEAKRRGRNRVALGHAQPLTPLP